MKVVAYCDERYKTAITKTIGGQAQIYTCPPLTDQDFESGQKAEYLLSGYDVVVFDLHGFPNASVWCSYSGLIALKAGTLSTLQLNNTGVFALCCHAGDSEQPMAQALQCAGAKYLIAGAGKNYAGKTYLAAGNWLLRWYLFFLKKYTPESALTWAKRFTQICALRWTKIERMALKDTLEFTLRRFNNEVD